MLDALIERLKQTTAFDAAFQLASAQTQLGRIYQLAGHAERAMPILREAAGAWERLMRQTANLSPSRDHRGSAHKRHAGGQTVARSLCRAS